MPGTTSVAVGAGAPAVVPPSRKGGGARPTTRDISSVWVATASTAALLLAWELLARGGFFPEEMESLSAVLSWTLEQSRLPEYRDAVGLTVMHWGLGLLIGAVVGGVVGAILGSIPLLRDMLNSTLEFLRPIPAVVYLPLLLLIWGGSDKVVIALAAVGAAWPMLYQTFYGIRSVDSVVIDTGRVYGLTRSQRLFLLKVPMMLPFVATGLRISASLALVVAISIELIGSVPGIGRELQVYSASGVYIGVYGYILTAGVLGTVLNLSLESLERRLLRWHPSHRQEAV